jgi:hypothetical protein
VLSCGLAWLCDGLAASLSQLGFAGGLGYFWLAVFAVLDVF